MGKIVAGMTVSLDGFVQDENGSAGPLYPDLASLQGTPYLTDMAAATGAVIMGRTTFDMAGDPDSYVESYELRAPIFVVTHRPPAVAPKQDEQLTFTFVTDGVESAAAQAKAAAGGKNVAVVGGVDVTRQLLRAGLVDELHVDVMPVLLGRGLRLFDDDTGVHQLAKLEVVEVGERVSLRYRVS